MKLSGFKTAIFLAILVTLAFVSSVSADTAITDVYVINEPGTYYLNNSIICGDSNGIIINCSDAILDGRGFYLEGSSNYCGIFAGDVTNVTIKNITVQNFYTGIYLLNVNNSILENNTAKLNQDEGIYLDISANNSITGNSVYSNGNAYTDIAIYLANSANNSIIRNNVSLNEGRGIGLWDSPNNVVLENNVSSNNNRGIWVYYSDNNAINGNTANSNYPEFGIYLENSANNALTNNTANENEDFGIYLYYSDNNALTNNTANSNDYMGICIENSANNSINGNTANSNDETGIYLGGSNNNAITGNNANLNGNYGIYLYYSDNNALTNNTANENEDYGIYLDNSDYNTITGNNANLNYNGSGEGIDLAASDYNILTANTVNENEYGIYLDNSDYNILTGNTALDSYMGIYSTDAEGNILKNNNMTRNEYGIYLHTSINHTITNNSFTKSGLYMDGYEIAEWNTHTIENNTVNGKKVYYFKNDVGKTVPIDAGQVILANCSNMNIENLNLFNTSAGVAIGYSSGNNITNVTTISIFDEGIRLYYSDGNTITGNTAINDSNGISVSNSDGNTITGNTANSNEYAGIYLSGSNDNNLTENIAYSNENSGILLSSSDNTTINGNTANSNYCGIYLENSDDNAITGNTLDSNTQGIQLYNSYRNLITSNNVLSNNRGIYLTNSATNTISRDIVVYNEYAIQLAGSDGNIINSNMVSANRIGVTMVDSNINQLYNNTFNNSEENFDITSSQNYWNTSAAMGGGNYWFTPIGDGWSETYPDYTGDGFCDPYYVLNENNIDYLPISILEPGVDDTIPNVTINSPIGTTYYVNSIAINVTATDDLPGISSVIAEIEGIRNITLELDGDYYIGNAENLSNGNYKITINATDWAGNSNSTESVSFKILTPEIYNLTTENNENIGLVSIFVDGDMLNFNYAITEPNWSISEVNLIALNESPNDTASIWYTGRYLIKNGRVKTFEISSVVPSGTLNLTAIPVDPSSTLYIAANAVVRKEGARKSVDAWADGTSISDKSDTLYVVYPK